MSNYNSIIEQNNTELQGVLDTVNELPDYVESIIESLTVTENGTYTAPEGVTGYSPVTVNVEGVKMATGTATTDSSYYLTVSGLSFTPQHIMLQRTSAEYYILLFCKDTAGWIMGGNGGSQLTVTLTITDGGFKAFTTSAAFQGQTSGTYNWIAWAE